MSTLRQQTVNYVDVLTEPTIVLLTSVNLRQFQSIDVQICHYVDAFATSILDTIFPPYLSKFLNFSLRFLFSLLQTLIFAFTSIAEVFSQVKRGRKRRPPSSKVTREIRTSPFLSKYQFSPKSLESSTRPLLSLRIFSCSPGESLAQVDSTLVL